MSVLIECLRAIAGSQHITTDALVYEYFSQKPYSAGFRAAAVVTPRDRSASFGGKAVSCVAKRTGLAILNVRKTYGWSTTKPAPKHVSNA
jgi:hypothetical protein